MGFDGKSNEGSHGPNEKEISDGDLKNGRVQSESGDDDSDWTLDTTFT